MSVQATLGDPASLWVPRSEPRALLSAPFLLLSQEGWFLPSLCLPDPLQAWGKSPGVGSCRLASLPGLILELSFSVPLSTSCGHCPQLAGRALPAPASRLPSSTPLAFVYVACSPLPDRPAPPACTLIVGQPLRFGGLWSSTMWEGLLDFPPTR